VKKNQNAECYSQNSRQDVQKEVRLFYSSRVAAYQALTETFKAKYPNLHLLDARDPAVYCGLASGLWEISTRLSHLSSLQPLQAAKEYTIKRLAILVVASDFRISKIWDSCITDTPASCRLPAKETRPSSQAKRWSLRRWVVAKSRNHLTKDWTSVPERYRSEPEVRDRFGRVGIEFQTAGWNPALAIGFLYDIRDHMVSLTAPAESVDLFLRIEADPRTNPQIDDILVLLREKGKLLSAKGPKVLKRNEQGNGNLWTLLFAQQSLLSVADNGLEERGANRGDFTIDSMNGSNACSVMVRLKNAWAS
jgi:hypothetical protein